MAVEWQERAVDGDLVAALAATGLTPVQARLLALRGVTVETVGHFFSPSMKSLAQPSELPGIAEAAATVLAAIRDKLKIVVFGDYDCDGVCATAILVRAVRALGGVVAPFLPARLTEGYGMNVGSVDRLLGEHPDVSLVVTVDNGINSTEHIAQLKSRGIDVVVTDHHLPGEDLPDCPIVNPKVASPEHLSGLCGAGVAYMLAAELVSAAKAAGEYTGSNIGGPLLVLAGLATVTDIMPLVGQNRILVSEALRRFRSWAPVGLRELLDRASRTVAPSLTARDFGFLIGPRINAAGRLASGMDALELILTSDREDARRLAQEVDFRNTMRKSIEQKMTDEALSQIKPGASAQVIVFTGESAHQGVAGIVAARILERCINADEPMPVCVIVNGHGSARSPEGYNVRDALQGAEEALVRFGGHAAAGGFTVRPGCTDRFRELFCAACSAQAASAPGAGKGIEFVDAEVDRATLTLDFAEWIGALEPFGEGNPTPRFLMRHVIFSDVRPIGSDGRHLQLFLFGDALRGIWWNHGDLVGQLRADAAHPHDIVFTIELSTYGEPHPELRFLAIARSAE